MHVYPGNISLRLLLNSEINASEFKNDILEIFFWAPKVYFERMAM